MKPLILLLLAMCCFHLAKAQTLSPAVIPVAGTSGSTGTIQLDWTLGDVAVQTLRTNSGIMTEGFHQPILWVTELPQTLAQQIQMSLAPNPVRSTLRITIGTEGQGNLHLVLTDVSGKPLQQMETPFAIGSRQLDLSGYPAGMYFLSVREENGSLLKSYKVVRSN